MAAQLRRLSKFGGGGGDDSDGSSSSEEEVDIEQLRRQAKQQAMARASGGSPSKLGVSALEARLQGLSPGKRHPPVGATEWVDAEEDKD